MSTDPTTPILVKYDERRGKVRRRWLSTWYDDKGKRRSKHFGFAPETTRTDAMRAYGNWVNKFKTRADVRNPTKDRPLTVARLAGLYLRHAGRTFVKEGERTTHVSNIKYAMRALRNAHSDEPADSIDAPALARLRDTMIYSDAQGERRALGMKTVNDRLQSIVAAYKWAREKGWVTAATVNDLANVARLRKGRTPAKPPGKVKAVDASIIEAVIAKVPAPVGGILRLMLLTGMRPGEACRVRACDMETNGDVWLYRPGRHKTEHHDHVRIIYFGPRCQAVIRPFLQRDTAAYLFSPAEAQAERLVAKRKARKTPEWPSHVAKRKGNPTANLGDRYTAGSVRKAILYACKKHALATFHPNQVRHTHATLMRKTYGIEAASAQLGHANLSTTEIYAERDAAMMMKIAKEIA